MILMKMVPMALPTVPIQVPQIPMVQVNLFQKPSFLHQLTDDRECVRNLDLRVQVHPGELRVSKQRVHIVLEASKSAGAKGDVPKIYEFVHPLHLC